MTQISRLSGIPGDYYNNPENNQIGALNFGSIFSSIKTGATKFAQSESGKQLIQAGGTALVNKLTAAKPTSSITLTSSPDASNQGSNSSGLSGNTGLILAACAIGAFILLDGKKKK